MLLCKGPSRLRLCQVLPYLKYSSSHDSQEGVFKYVLHTDFKEKYTQMCALDIEI